MRLIKPLPLGQQQTRGEAQVGLTACPNHCVVKPPSIWVEFQGPPNSRAFFGGAARNSLGGDCGEEGLRATDLGRCLESHTVCCPAPGFTAGWPHPLELLHVLSTLPSSRWSGTCFPQIEPSLQAKMGGGGLVSAGRGTEGGRGDTGCAADGPGSRLEPAARLWQSEASFLIICIQPHLQMTRFMREALGICSRI